MKPNTKVFAVYDSKAEAFMQPFFAETVGLALRYFQQNTENHESVLYKYPNDFVLFQIAAWDEHTGDIHNLEQNINLGMAIEFHPSGKLEAVQDDE